MHNPETTVATIFGTAASGKDTALDQLQPDPFYYRIVNSTTRSPRPGEVSGSDYYFISEAQHATHVEAGEYLTHTHANDRYYGVLHSELTKAKSAAALPIGHFGIEDHKTLWRKNDEQELCVRSLLLLTPSFDTWNARMQARLQTGFIRQDEFSRRAQGAVDELHFALGAIDRFIPIISDTPVSVKNQINAHFKGGQPPATETERVVTLIDQFERFIDEQETTHG
jgi:guanylate kinase